PTTPLDLHSFPTRRSSDLSRPPVRNFFRGFGAVFYKEVLHVRRDPATLFFSLVIPLLQMVVLGFGIDTNIRQINTVVLNADGRRDRKSTRLNSSHLGISYA